MESKNLRQKDQFLGWLRSSSQAGEILDFELTKSVVEDDFVTVDRVNCSATKILGD